MGHMITVCVGSAPGTGLISALPMISSPQCMAGQLLLSDKTCAIEALTAHLLACFCHHQLPQSNNHNGCVLETRLQLGAALATRAEKCARHSHRTSYAAADKSNGSLPVT